MAAGFRVAAKALSAVMTLLESVREEPGVSLDCLRHWTWGGRDPAVKQVVQHALITVVTKQAMVLPDVLYSPMVLILR